jgi:hypothetical protein
MKQYQFDFSKFTIGHLAALSNGYSPASMTAIDELTVGGASHLPISELGNLLSQFLVAYKEYADREQAEIQARMLGDFGIDDEVVSDMLDGIEGL